MFRQPEIVVGAHVEHLGAARNRDVSILRGGNHAFAFFQASGTNRFELFEQMALKLTVQFVASLRDKLDDGWIGA